MQGHLYEEAMDQFLMASHLHDSLTSIMHNAKVFRLKVTNSEPFSGPTDNLSDKWLLAVQLSKSLFKPRCILLSLPPTYLDDAGSTLCQPPALASSYAFFTHKYPILTGEKVLFFGEPLFLCPWTYHPAEVKDTMLEKTGAWMNGIDAIEILISWIR